MKFGVACAMLAHQFQQYVTTQWQVVSRGRADRGSVTIEQVIWAAAVIAIGRIGFWRADSRKGSAKATSSLRANKAPDCSIASSISSFLSITICHR